MKVAAFQYNQYNMALQLSKTGWCRQAAVPLLHTLSIPAILALCTEWKKEENAISGVEQIQRNRWLINVYVRFQFVDA